VLVIPFKAAHKSLSLSSTSATHHSFQEVLITSQYRLCNNSLPIYQESPSIHDVTAVNFPTCVRTEIKLLNTAAKLILRFKDCSLIGMSSDCYWRNWCDNVQTDTQTGFNSRYIF